jgi:hypothetical protein
MTVSLAHSPGSRGKWNSEHWCLKARELEVNEQGVGGQPSVEPANAIFSGTRRPASVRQSVEQVSQSTGR